MRTEPSHAIKICGDSLPEVGGSGIEPSCSEILQKLKKNPEDPALIRYQADILKEHGDMSDAADLYCKAASLLLKDGRITAALALKLTQWRISSPSKTDFNDFLLELNQVSAENKPVKAFLGRLNLQESLALYSSFEIIALEPNQVIVGIGDLEDHLYLVASGTLKASTYHTVDDKQKFHKDPSLYLHPDDFFGDVYPFDGIKKSKSHLESKSPVELLSISQEKLKKICAQHPRMEHRIMELLKVRSGICRDNFSENVRGSRRIQLKLQLGIEIRLNGSQQTSILLTGYTKDVSIGGICFILDEMGFITSSEISSLECSLKLAKVRVNFPVEELQVSIPGKIVWLNTVSNAGRKTMALGIQFDEMSPKLKGLLMMFFNSFDKM